MMALQHARRSFGSWFFDLLNSSFLLLVSATFIYPFIYVFSVSTSDLEPIAFQRVNVYPIALT